MFDKCVNIQMFENTYMSGVFTGFFAEKLLLVIHN